VKWDKGQSITLVRNDEYWGTKALMSKLIFQFIKENNVRASKLANGEIDAMDGLDPNDVKMLQDKKMSIFQAKGMNINYMLFNCERAPFNDPKLREAICHAINVPELVTALYQGYAQVANSPLPDFMPGYDKDTQQYAYDVEKAKSMLKDLGKEGMTIKMITYPNPRPYNPVNGQKLAEAVQGYLMKVGLKVEILPYEWTEYKKRIGNGEGDIGFYGWTGDNGDTDNFLSLLETKEIKSTLNSAKYSNAQVDELLAKGRILPNGADRNNAYIQIQKIMATDAPWLPISHSIVLAAYSPNVKGFSVHPTGSVFFAGVSK
jgi:peptide/nickel transport system substrate-binding protein